MGRRGVMNLHTDLWLVTQWVSMDLYLKLGRSKFLIKENFQITIIHSNKYCANVWSCIPNHFKHNFIEAGNLSFCINVVFHHNLSDFGERAAEPNICYICYKTTKAQLSACQLLTLEKELYKLHMHLWTHNLTTNQFSEI